MGPLLRDRIVQRVWVDLGKEQSYLSRETIFSGTNETREREEYYSLSILFV